MKAYLIWCGNEFYPSKDAWSDEAVKLGVSRRVGNAAIAHKMMEEDTVTLVAHNEGKTSDCAKCLGKIECPECRKRSQETVRLSDDLEALQSVDDEKKKTKSWSRSKRIRTERLAQLREETRDCECKGTGVLKKVGTGGKVIMNDGSIWDYRKYNYWLHQPGRFNPEDSVEEVIMCEHCGGTGEMPLGEIFALFVPQRIEYILKGDEPKPELKELAKAGIKLIPADKLKVEPPRGCGKRKPGGFYVVTDTKDEPITVIKDGALETLGGCDLLGSYVRFGNSIPVPGVKKFRGAKKFEWSRLDPSVQTEIDLIREAFLD